MQAEKYESLQVFLLDYVGVGSNSYELNISLSKFNGEKSYPLCDGIGMWVPGFMIMSHGWSSHEWDWCP